MKIHLLMILCVLLLTIGCPAPHQEPVKISIPIIKEAKNIALPKDSRMHIVWAGGEKKNNELMTDPEMTETFGFVAVAYEPSGWNLKSWRLEYGNEWTISPIDMPLGFNVSIDLGDVEMDVCDAWRLVKMNNYATSFYSWQLFLSINPSFLKNPYFMFETSGELIYVDTVTSEIKIEKKH